jgi:hypothetical protein
MIFTTHYRKTACEIPSHPAHKKSCKHERSSAEAQHCTLALGPRTSNLKREAWNLKTCLNTQVTFKSRSSAAPNHSSAFPNSFYESP